MSCSKTSNNKYLHFPARMADARFCTDYRPSSYVENAIRVSNNINNSHQYRLFLQRNAEQLFNLNNQLMFARNGCGQCKAPYDQGTIPNNRSELNCNKDGCTMVDVDPSGFGLGINYQSVQTAQFAQPSFAPNNCVDDRSRFNQSGL